MSPGKSKPATSVRSVGGMKACATSRCGSPESELPSGGGKMKPALLSKGSSEEEEKRPFHIKAGKNAVLRTIGARRMLRGPARSGPTMPLLSIPIAIGWLSPKPLVGEWQPAHVLSPLSPVIVSNQSSRPMFASGRLIGLPSRCVSVDSIRPVKPTACKRAVSCSSTR